jgi:lysozyme family protein
MMKDNFESSQQQVLVHEGGWADHPKDPGGATMKGVTLMTFCRHFE